MPRRVHENTDKRGLEQLRMAEQFICFARNGVWGTCGDCPETEDYHTYPEFCINWMRHDHQMCLKELYETHERSK